MRFGVLMLYFNAEKFILAAISNTAPYVETIYISYSKVPWNAYNKDARKYTNNSSLAIIEASLFRHKIKIIEGVWESEHDQRNSVVKQAISDGMDYLIIQDPDEFYLPDEFNKNLQSIIDQPDYPFYYNPWINFWKSTKHVLLERVSNEGIKNTIYNESANFAVNLSRTPSISFVNKRGTSWSYDKGLRIPGVCLHLSYVYSDEELKVKLATWGHSHEVQKFWFKYKWLAWQPQTKYLHPTQSPIWIKAVPYSGLLPNEIQNFPLLSQKTLTLNSIEKLHCAFLALFSFIDYYKRQIKGRIAAKLRIGQYKR